MSIQRLADRLRSTLRGSGGFSLVEVLVAMLVFAIVAISVAYSLTLTAGYSRDNRAREQATAIALADIDLVRSVGDPFAVSASDPPPVVPAGLGETFTITRTTAWVTSSGADVSCSAGGTTLQYKRVNVSVSWTNMARGSVPATADTIIAPNVHINDPSKGTIFVSVQDVDGVGVAGITPSISPAPGVAIAPTDADGCTFILGVAPRSYTVSLTRSGWVDQNQNPTSSLTSSVTAGNSTAYAFQFDQAINVTARYAVNVASLPNPTTKVEFPLAPGGTGSTQLQTTFVKGSDGWWSEDTPVTESATNGFGTLTAAVPLHPYPTGYQTIAGQYTTACQVSDPEAWQEYTYNGVTYSGARGIAQSAAPGSTTAPVSTPMGVVQVTTPANATSGFPTSSRTRYHLVAVRQTNTAGSPVTGEPACPSSAGTVVYRFGQVFTGANQTVRIALPFGTWKVYATNTDTTNTSSNSTTLTSTNLTLLSNVLKLDPAASNPLTGTQTIPTSGTDTGRFTLDPRGVVVP
ncbi:prepilin-type N-terminal cleavage/methylation domain-containing protein [Agromyces seonyuensis]|uniref:Prepilin-type N-terminal cleavage/methylation domain-containing protein n=1 Tax=Agromyces seonyuensis TaxID=2662446 RepID=A0A6I4P5A2_9MICO|nr:prepilin-type N-terminal cleavage/methylation domain-containing protein [Agromyces seonyuensis]MWB99589.1 prepilin-type N-terminal cleavage/methylation domain-containing protein [Agromyces seonyuensis]